MWDELIPEEIPPKELTFEGKDRNWENDERKVDGEKREEEEEEETETDDAEGFEVEEWIWDECSAWKWSKVIVISMSDSSPAGEDKVGREFDVTTEKLRWEVEWKRDEVEGNDDDNSGGGDDDDDDDDT